MYPDYKPCKITNKMREFHVCQVKGTTTAFRENISMRVPSDRMNRNRPFLRLGRTCYNGNIIFAHVGGNFRRFCSGLDTVKPEVIYRIVFGGVVIACFGLHTLPGSRFRFGILPCSAPFFSRVKPQEYQSLKASARLISFGRGG